MLPQKHVLGSNDVAHISLLQRDRETERDLMSPLTPRTHNLFRRYESPTPDDVQPRTDRSMQCTDAGLPSPVYVMGQKSRTSALSLMFHCCYKHTARPVTYLREKLRNRTVPASGEGCSPDRPTSAVRERKAMGPRQKVGRYSSSVSVHSTKINYKYT